MIISGNYSNMEVVRRIIQTLDTLKIKSEYKVISATRSPEKLESFIKDIDDDVDMYVAVSSLSTILTGVIVSHTTKPVIGVPCENEQGNNYMLTTVNMPPGVPAATVGTNNGKNAAVLAGEILSIYNDGMVEVLEKLKNKKINL